MVVKHPRIRLIPIKTAFIISYFKKLIRSNLLQTLSIAYNFTLNTCMYDTKSIASIYQFIPNQISFIKHNSIISLQSDNLFLIINPILTFIIIFSMQGQNSQYRAPRTVKVFFSQVHKYYTQRDSNKLAQNFKQLYFGNDYKTLSFQSWNASIKISSEYASFHDSVTPHFVKILQLIKSFEMNRKSKQWQIAFDTHLKLVIECLQLIKEMKDLDFMWLLKPTRTLIRATKRIFLESMKHILNSSKLKNDLINTLNRFKSTRSLLEQVRVEIIPLIENMQVSILFNFHNYEMIKMIVYTSKLSLNPDNKFRDNFLFLKAKYALVNEKFKEAEQYFQMINIKTSSQKRLVLKYLIPCKIFLGKMFQPRGNLPDEYFPEYETLIKALKNASFKNFDYAIQKYQKVWIKRGIYLLMDRLRVLIWRNLIKRVYHALGEKIMFEKIEKAVKLAGGQENINECICIIGNLIYEGYVKGIIYQNETVRGLILKKDKCFPKLSDIVG